MNPFESSSVRKKHGVLQTKILFSMSEKGFEGRESSKNIAVIVCPINSMLSYPIHSILSK